MADTIEIMEKKPDCSQCPPECMQAEGPSREVEVVAPEPTMQASAIKVAESQVDILSTAMDIMMKRQVAPVFDDAMQVTVDNFLKAMRYNPEAAAMIKENADFAEEIMASSTLLLKQLSAIFEDYGDTPPDDFGDLIVSAEVFLKSVDEYVRAVRDFRVNPTVLGNTQDLTKAGTAVRNATCDTIREIMRVSPNMVEGALKAYLNARFCPESYKQHQEEIKSTTWYQTVRNKVRNIARAVRMYGGTYALYGMWQTSFTKQLCATINFVQRNYLTILVTGAMAYFFYQDSGVGAIANLGSAVFGGEGAGRALWELIIIVARAGCYAGSFVGAQYVAGAVARWLTTKVLSLPIFMALWQSMKTGIAAAVGNALNFLAPIFMGSWLNDNIKWVIDTACYSMGQIMGTGPKAFVRDEVAPYVRGKAMEVASAFSWENLSGAFTYFDKTWNSMSSWENTSPEELLQILQDDLDTDKLVLIGDAIYNLMPEPLKLVGGALMDAPYKLGAALPDLSSISTPSLRDIWNYMRRTGKEVPVTAVGLSLPEVTGMGVAPPAPPDVYPPLLKSDYNDPYLAMVREALAYATEQSKRLGSAIASLPQTCSNTIAKIVSATIAAYRKYYGKCANLFSEWMKFFNNFMAVYWFVTQTYQDVFDDDRINELQESVRALRTSNQYIKLKQRVKDRLLPSVDELYGPSGRQSATTRRYPMRLRPQKRQRVE